jgi:hypothetical protein
MKVSSSKKKQTFCRNKTHILYILHVRPFQYLSFFSTTPCSGTSIRTFRLEGRTQANDGFTVDRSPKSPTRPFPLFCPFPAGHFSLSRTSTHTCLTYTVPASAQKFSRQTKFIPGRIWILLISHRIRSNSVKVGSNFTEFQWIPSNLETLALSVFTPASKSILHQV